MDLKPGEVECDKCKGTRILYDFDNYDIGKYNTCPKCKGEGKLDWIEVIVGKNSV